MAANRTQLQNALHKPYDRLLFSREVLNPVFGSGFSLFSSPTSTAVSPNKSESTVIDQVKIYGKILLDDSTEITCYEVLLQPKVRIEQSKVAIQQYIRKLLTAGQAALINFVSPSTRNVWRLTLVAKDSVLTESGVKDKTTNAKRYTFLLGPSETCRTAAERFEALSIENQMTFQSLVNAFSVEKLSKAFFDEYTLHYQNFCDYLQESNYRKSVFNIDFPNNATKEEKDKASKPIRDFVKKMLGRIVFLYFVQKKGWLGASDTDYTDGPGDFIRRLFTDSGGDETFYSNWLTVLFFDTLNKKRTNDDFTMPDGKRVKVPFLNGGLFDMEEFDGSLLTFPPALFHHPDFEDVLLTEKNAGYARGFLDFLDAFNFTVYEDSPDDHTVAVDPEMLGHIFENLLEDNKDKGAFYTPKEIVHYMCQESLIEYLKNSPPVEGCQTQSDGVANTPDDTQTQSDGVANTPDDLQTHSDGVANTPDDTQTQSDGVANSPDDLQTHSDGVANSPDDTQTQSDGVATIRYNSSMQSDGVANTPDDTQTHSDGVANTPDDTQTHSDGVASTAPKALIPFRNAKNYFSLPYNPNLKKRARLLRKAGNLSEVLFWNRVKNKQFKGFDFDRQKVIGNYIVDFYCTNTNVVVEIDGSSHDNKQEYERERDEYLQSLGLTVIHIPVEDVMKNMDGVMQMLYNHPAMKQPAVTHAEENPPLTPPVEGNLEEKNDVAVLNSPPMEGCQTQSDGVANSPDDLQTQSDGVANSPDDTQTQSDGVANSPDDTQTQSDGVANTPDDTQTQSDGVANTPDDTQTQSDGVATTPNASATPSLSFEQNWEKKVRRLVKEKEATSFTMEELKHIDQLLDNVKICDPAIGSGAFPMGLLHEILSLKELIAYETGKAWNPAEAKLNIIQNSIYGVDIEKGAVDIARLRFWLSLVIDEEKPKPLPNLDYKIVVGDSLISKFDGEIIEIDWEVKEGTQTDMFGNENLQNRKQLLQQLTDKQRKYFDPKDKNKQALALEIRNHKIDILINQLELMVKTEGLEHAPAKANFMNNKNFVAACELYQKSQGWIKTIDKLKYLQQHPDEPFHHFDWKLDFPEVLNPYLVPDENQRGFDIVIGNPPYISIRTNSFNKSIKNILKDKYDLAVGQFDIYVLFFELTNKIIRQNGTFSFITPQRILSNETFEKAREFLIMKMPIMKYVNVEMPFENAKVEANIMIGTKSNVANFVDSFLFSLETNKLTFLSEISYSFIKIMPFKIFPFVFDKKRLILLENMQLQNNKVLSDFLEITRGFECGYSDASIVDYETKYPLIKSEAIQKYFVDSSEILFCNPDFQNSSKFKSIELFTKVPKLLTKFTSNEIIFAKDNTGYFNTNSVYNCHLINNQLNYDFLLSILNSKLITFWFNTAFLNIDNLFPHIQKNQLDAIPIKVPNNTKQFEWLSQYIQYLKIQNYKIVVSYFQQVIDGMVYELYFPELIEKYDCEIIKYLGELPEFTESMSDEEKMEICKTVYDRLSDASHPVRIHLEKMKKEIPEIRIIEGLEN